MGSCLPLSFPTTLPTPIKIASLIGPPVVLGPKYSAANAIAQSVKLAAMGCSTYDTQLRVRAVYAIREGVGGWVDT